MPGQRRLWDSCVAIGYLAGDSRIQTDCERIIQQAQRGEAEIAVSVMATIEVAYLQGYSASDSEAHIKEFFSRDYVIPIAIDMGIAEIARGLIRKYRTGPRIKPPDAIHLATAMQWKIPIVETTDPGLLRLDRLEGDPPITIRTPLYEGPRELPGFSAQRPDRRLTNAASQCHIPSNSRTGRIPR